MLARLRAEPPDREVGDALLDQRLLGGIGNIWRSEALWDVRVSPWSTMGEVADETLLSLLRSAHRLMSASVRRAPPVRNVYRRAGRPCRRCGTPVRAHAQGDAARRAYWCPQCQRGAREPRS
jgi:endonuclease-8